MARIDWLQQFFHNISPSLPSSTKMAAITHGRDCRGPGEGSRITPDSPRGSPDGMRGRVWGKGGVGGELEAYSLLVWASSQQAPSHTCISPQICRHDWSDDEMRLDSGKMRWCGAMRRLPCRHPPVPRQPARPDASGTFTLTPADPNLVQTAVFQLSTTSAEAAITTWSSPHISHPPDVVQQLSDLHVHDVPPGPPPATAIPSRDALSALRPGPMAVRAGFTSHAGVLQPHVPRQ